MNVFIIIICLAVVAIAGLYFSAKNAQEVKEVKEQEPKFQPRKVTIVVSETEKPKRKKKRYYNNKKKQSVSESAPVAKRPVGRPRKSN